MRLARQGHGAALLADGRVVVAGGSCDYECANDPSASTEIYDPLADRWSVGAPLPVPAPNPAVAVVVRGGDVLVVSGTNNTARAAQILNLVLGVWIPVGPTTFAHFQPVAARLGNGDALVLGWSELANSGGYDEADVYRGASKTFAPVKTPYDGSLQHFTATTLRDGRVLVAGGQGDDQRSTDAFVFAP
jgi:hypothetical protein